MQKVIQMLSLVLVLAPGFCYAEGVKSLSPGLRALLKEEMTAIEQGMQAIIPAYVSGDMDTVAEIAGQIKSSYILKQKITKEQKQELHSTLPQDFIARDKQFHQYAGKLERVSQENKPELAGFYYGKMLDSCVGCHTAYATHRFPGLASDGDKEHSH